MSEDMASRPQIRISVAKRCQNSGSTKGLSASAPTTTAKPVQYAALGPSPRARVSSSRSVAVVASVIFASAARPA